MAGVAVEIVAPWDIGIDIDPDETADTFAGNALLKDGMEVQIQPSSTTQSANPEEPKKEPTKGEAEK